MTDREKLIDLLDMNCGYVDEMLAADLADLLIANGVTFEKDTNVGSKWISVEERLPTVDDADEVGHIIAIIKGDEFAQIFCWRSIVNFPGSFTHWMPLPKPPKEVADG